MKLLQVFKASNYTKWQLSNLVCHSPIRLRLSPTVEPSSTVVSLEWIDVQPAIGTKVSDYILQHKKVDEYTDTDLYTGKNISLFWVGGGNSMTEGETRFSNFFMDLMSTVLRRH